LTGKTQPIAKAHILFVEDSRTQGAETKKVLEKKGYAVTWVRDGMSAFHAAMTRPVDVILLDRVLPDMEGNKICAWFKSNRETQGIPVIMLTSMIAIHEIVNGLTSGADDYLAKPYEEEELSARIYAALRTKALQDELRNKNEELKKMLARVELLSITDPLTGLFNRRRFESLLDLEFKKSVRYATPLSCMVIDIDHFKAVNDTYGHAAGDAVIKDVALLVKEAIRDVDTACRSGGEEFSVLVPMTTKADALIPARRILAAVSDHDFEAVGDKQITVSIGLANVPDPDIEMADKLVQAADAALYAAKKLGRNRIETAGQ
jgi:two-component system cell cycle response regulator